MQFSFNWHLYSIIDGGKRCKEIDTFISSYAVQVRFNLRHSLKKKSRFPRAEVLCYKRVRYPAIVAEFYVIVMMDQRRCMLRGRERKDCTTDTYLPFRCRLCLIWWRPNAIKHWSIDVKWCLCVAPNTCVC